jgi:hypothetical protein
MASRSQANSRLPTFTLRNPSLPEVPVTVASAQYSAPAALANAAAASLAGRGSTTATTRTPARARSTAVANAASLLANTTARRPAATPYWCKYRRTAPASITPGRSLPGNTSGRSIAPEASTVCRATIRHRR